MKLSEQTVEVLQNFSTINQSLLFREGRTLRTVSPQKTVLAEVEVGDEFSQDFGIYDLGQFLSALSLVENPELDLGDNGMTISDGNGTSLNYRYADASMIVTPPEKALTLPDINASFKLSSNVLRDVLQGARVLGLPEIIVKCVDEVVTIEAGDSKNSSMNSYSKKVAIADEDFTHTFKVDNMKMMMLDYNVEISSKGISKFSTEDGRVTYFVATESRN
tara:strand:- start:1954 stop:2610 length:657 start_codon:yes stop_codon:yes gene_type:complete